MSLEAKHMDEGKTPLQYILAMPGLDDVARVGEYGFKKYGDRWNYRKGMPWSKLLGSCGRHLAAYIRGQNLDPESGLSHVAHLAYDCLMLLEYPGVFDEQDDRYKAPEEAKKEPCCIPSDFECTCYVCRSSGGCR